jgi:hypothetical protein
MSVHTDLRSLPLKCQVKYGMDEKGSYKQQGLFAYENAYSKGRMTLSQLYEEKQRLSVNQVAGVEDPTYGIKGDLQQAFFSKQ